MIQPIIYQKKYLIMRYKSIRQMSCGMMTRRLKKCAAAKILLTLLYCSVVAACSNEFIPVRDHINNGNADVVLHYKPSVTPVILLSNFEKLGVSMGAFAGGAIGGVLVVSALTSDSKPERDLLSFTADQVAKANYTTKINNAIQTEFSNAVPKSKIVINQTDEFGRQSLVDPETENSRPIQNVFISYGINYGPDIDSMIFTVTIQFVDGAKKKPLSSSSRRTQKPLSIVREYQLSYQTEQQNIPIIESEKIKYKLSTMTEEQIRSIRSTREFVARELVQKVSYWTDNDGIKILDELHKFLLVVPHFVSYIVHGNEHPMRDITVTLPGDNIRKNLSLVTENHESGLLLLTKNGREVVAVFGDRWRNSQDYIKKRNVDITELEE